jgi:hypothetical protein
LVALRSLKFPEALRFVCLMPAYAACAKKFMQEDKTMKYFTVARQQTAMHQQMQPWLNTMSHKPAPSRLGRQGSLVTLVLGLSLSVVPAILNGKNLPAQTQIPQATKPAQHQKAEVTPSRRREQLRK